MLVVRIALVIQLPNSRFSQISGIMGLLRTSSKMVTSIILWLKYAGLFLTTLTATTSCVFMFWHLTT